MATSTRQHQLKVRHATALLWLMLPLLRPATICNRRSPVNACKQSLVVMCGACTCSLGDIGASRAWLLQNTCNCCILGRRAAEQRYQCKKLIAADLCFQIELWERLQQVCLYQLPSRAALALQEGWDATDAGCGGKQCQTPGTH